MLLQSLLSDLTIGQPTDDGSQPDLREVASPPSHSTSLDRSQALSSENQSVLFEVRPVVFDRKHTLARLGGLEELLMDVLQVMRVESPKVRTQLDTAFACRDASELKRAAHTLMGSASLAGARDLMDRLRRVEELAVASDFETIANELPEIDRQFNSLKCCLDDELMDHA